MLCPSCGSTNAEQARFCSLCGTRFPEETSALHLVLPSKTALRCPHCGDKTVPMPFFARGVNVAKLFLLFPFTSFLGPLIYFFIRKDRLICRRCQKFLPQTRSMPLLEAFSDGSGMMMLGNVDASPREDALTLSTAEDDLAASVLEKKARKAKTLAWAMGLSSMFFITASLFQRHPGGGLGFGVVLGSIALFCGLRASQSGKKAGFLKRRIQTLRVLHLARKYRGRLNVTVVSAAMGLDFKEAEALLDSMVDGQRVDMDVSDEGQVTYVFPELIRSL